LQKLQKLGQGAVRMADGMNGPGHGVITAE
jgi:hypothetical protein